jgi:starch-binding outer membrane protein, SusD/RagB family
MKKYMVILTLACTFAVVGCKGFLDEVATSQVASNSYFRNFAEANTALTGVYQQLGKVYEFSITPAAWGICGTDEVTIPTWEGGKRDLHKYNIQTNNNDVLNIWKRCYVGIYRANQVIARVGVMTVDQIKPDQQAKLIGEAKFLRALYYFQLTKIYGDVPLTTTEIKSESDIPNTRTATDKVYELIIDDLKYAKANCRTALLSGIVNKGAATALLGKVYLQMTGFPLNQTDKAALAVAEFKEVVENPAYGLAPKYDDLFDPAKELNGDVMKENIFVVKYDGPGKGVGGQLGSYMGPLGDPSNGGGYGTTYANTAMALRYDTAVNHDVRFARNIVTVHAGTGAIITWLGDWRPWKWRKPMRFEVGPGLADPGYDNAFDFALIRYADVLLMYAEAINIVNNRPNQAAIDALNKVRERARGIKNDPTILPNYRVGMTKNQFVDVLLLERYYELCFEGLRKDDLIRTGKLISALKALDMERWDTPEFGRPANIQDFQLNFPIPIAEIQISKMTQNKGY